MGEGGAVEKMNQLIRRFVPKRSDISKVSEDTVRWIEGILNNKPLECLQFKTPAEMFARSAKLKTFVVQKMIPSYYSPTQAGWGLEGRGCSIGPSVFYNRKVTWREV